jgi:hypothetical protein
VTRKTLVRNCARLTSLALVFSFTAGFAGLFPPGPIRPVPIKPFLDRPARLTMLHNVTVVRGGSLVAVIVDFDGYDLAITSTQITAETIVQGTVRNFLDATPEPYFYDLFEVHNKAGEILGYLLMHGERIESTFLYNDKEVFIDVVEVLTP